MGEPNVLSDAATPNVLSTQTGAFKPLAVRSPGQAGTVARAAPAPQANESWLATGQSATAARVRLPSFGTLIFLGFLAITIFRVLGEFASGFAEPTTVPVASGTAAPGGAGTQPGRIVFGMKSDGDCGVLETGVEFPAGSLIWWSAELSTVQPADAAAVVVVRLNGAEVERQDVPADTSVGEWSVLCATEPLMFDEPGAYRVEVWDEQEAVLNAAGEYRVRDP